MRYVVAVLALLAATAVQAQTTPAPAKVFGIALGAHGVWIDAAEAANPSDVEAGVHARASLSPHITLVGSADYGFDNQYITAAGGLRITATDVKDKSFSVGVGLQYRWYDDELYQPKEWAPDVSVGWRPWEASQVILTGTGAYGLTTERARATLGVRYRIY